MVSIENEQSRTQAFQQTLAKKRHELSIKLEQSKQALRSQAVGWQQRQQHAKAQEDLREAELLIKSQKELALQSKQQLEQLESDQARLDSQLKTAEQAFKSQQAEF